MHVAPLSTTGTLWETCFEAAVESGHPFVEDCNAETGEGVSFHENKCSRREAPEHGRCLPDPSRDRANLTVRAGAHVRRLLGEHHLPWRRVLGSATSLLVAGADREVILTAGAIPTPTLLLLSGIGPGDHLRCVGVDVKVDLPGVGENFHDHVKSQVAYTTTKPVHVPVLARKPHVMLRSDASVEPDLHILFTDFPVRPRWEVLPETGYSVVFGLLTPASRGWIRLASSDPDQPPLVNPNLLADPSDLDRMIRGLQVAQEIGSAKALAPMREEELFPGPEIRTGTPNTAPTSGLPRPVIPTSWDPARSARTRWPSSIRSSMCVGVDNLRIADASVMPSIPSANTNPSVIAVAERAADLIIAGRA